MNSQLFIHTNSTIFSLLSFSLYRRRSELIIESAHTSDSGQYECRAKNKIFRLPVRKFTTIKVLPKSKNTLK